MRRGRKERDEERKGMNEGSMEESISDYQPFTDQWGERGYRIIQLGKPERKKQKVWAGTS